MRNGMKTIAATVLVGLVGISMPGLSGVATAQPQQQTDAKVQADFHRVLASWIEARSVEKPDSANVAKLREQVDQLRNKLQTHRSGASCPLGTGFRGAGRSCACCACCAYCARQECGGFGMGYGRGRGFGRGQGWGRGKGYGRGRGRSFVDANSNGVCDNRENR